MGWDELLKERDRMNQAGNTELIDPSVSGSARAIDHHMLKVMSEIGVIGKDRRHQQGFSFRSIEDFYNRIHPLMIQEGIITIPEVLDLNEHKLVQRIERNGKEQEREAWRVSVRVRYTFRAQSDGSQLQVIAAGEAIDYSDKATSKAQAVAHKYALQQVFMIPTEDTSETPAKQGRNSGRTSSTAPEKKPPTELEKAKGAFLRQVVDLRKGVENKGTKDTPTDVDWVRLVAKLVLGKETIDTMEELNQVKADVEKDRFGTGDGSELPF